MAENQGMTLVDLEAAAGVLFGDVILCAQVHPFLHCPVTGQETQTPRPRPEIPLGLGSQRGANQALTRATASSTPEKRIKAQQAWFAYLESLRDDQHKLHFAQLRQYGVGLKTQVLEEEKERKRAQQEALRRLRDFIKGDRDRKKAEMLNAAEAAVDAAARGEQPGVAYRSRAASLPSLGAVPQYRPSATVPRSRPAIVRDSEELRQFERESGFAIGRG